MWPMLAGMALNTGVGMAGNAASGEAKDQALGYLANGLNGFQQIQAPSINDQSLNLNQEQQVGDLTPQMEQLYTAPTSAMAGVNANSNDLNAQNDALSSLQGIADSGGMNLTDKANLAGVINNVNQNSKSNRDAIMQNMASKGTGGSGFDLASQLAGQQADANTASSQGLSIDAQAQARALAALQSAGTMASGMNDQSFGQGAQKATATDAINKFNTQNSQAVAGANTAATNSAQAANLAAAQGVSNSNVATQNQQQIANKGLYQSQFDNQMAKAGGVEGADANLANAILGKNGTGTAQSTANAYAGVGSAASQAGTALSAYGQPAGTQMKTQQSPYDQLKAMQ